MRDGYYRTGDVAMRDADGYLTFVGRADDVFKASDYRISPFELESALIEHEAVAEAAVVPSPDPVRLAVPKAFVTLARTCREPRALALDILAVHPRPARALQARAPHRVRTSCRRPFPARSAGSSCARWRRRRQRGGRDEGEFLEEDFPELKGPQESTRAPRG